MRPISVAMAKGRVTARHLDLPRPSTLARRLYDALCAAKGGWVDLRPYSGFGCDIRAVRIRGSRSYLHAPASGMATDTSTIWPPESSKTKGLRKVRNPASAAHRGGRLRTKGLTDLA